jgi:type II secretory pathway pseudopilin PulG
MRTSATNIFRSDERGFTLIETLVAILTGVIVTGALFAILEVSLRQTSRITDVVQADQLGRGSMTQIIGELRSACISPEFTPIQEKSTESTLWFQDAYSSKPVIEKGETYEHELVWSESGKTLTDNIYAASGGEWPKFTFPSKPTSSKLIGENIVQAENSKGKKVPIFRYYKYASSSSGGTESGQSTLEEVPLEGGKTLGATAKEISSVDVTFSQESSNKYTALGRNGEFNSQVTFAFTAPYAETPIVDGPCQ